MPKEAKSKPDYIAAAKLNLNAPDGITIEQYTNRATAAQAQATIALAEQQKRAAAAAELGNMIAARHMGIFRSADEYAAVESKIRGLLGLDA